MQAPALDKVRRSLVPLARGKVLEVGIGSGLNLPYYDSSVNLTGIDPSLELQSYARSVAEESGISVDFLAQGGEEMALDDNSFDTVLITWTLCTIPDPMKALSEIRRVLKPTGQVIFAEHGIAPDIGIARWQTRINPAWKMIGGGCNLNRPIEQLYEDAGFKFSSIERGYLPGPKVATYNYRGVAVLG